MAMIRGDDDKPGLVEVPYLRTRDACCNIKSEVPHELIELHGSQLGGF